MNAAQLSRLLSKDRNWNIAVIQTMFRQPVGVSPNTKVEIVNNILIILDEEGHHPFKHDKDKIPLTVTTEMHIELSHILSVDYFTEKKIMSVKKSSIILS